LISDLPDSGCSEKRKPNGIWKKPSPIFESRF
jgi:hypothetical protein